MHMSQGVRDAYVPGVQGTSAGLPPATMITYVVMWSIHVMLLCHAT